MKLWVQKLLPHHLLTAMAGTVTHWRFKPWKRFLVGVFCRAYRPNLKECAPADPESYEHFNAFFTRSLKPGARCLPADTGQVISPVDGVLSQFGQAANGRMIQAKGMCYSAAELLGNPDWGAQFDEGNFLTLYLSPAHYHRVHMPVNGSLQATRFIPGRLFSVAPFTVRGIPNLFCRNERLVCMFETPVGLMAQVLVGAMLVAGIETVWHGRCGHPGRASQHNFKAGEVQMKRGEEMGRFNYGSTVIVLFQRDRIHLQEGLYPTQEVTMGEPLGRVAKANRSGQC